MEKFKLDLQLFGKGGGGTTVTERPLTPEEKELISTQTGYIKSLQPAVNSLVNRGTSQLGNVFTPDYAQLYNNAKPALDQNLKSVNELATGKLPSSYTNNKQANYNQMYNNTFGNTLASAAKRGVIGGSSLGRSIDSMQKNMTAQMSQDYGKDLQTQSGLLSQQQSSIMQPFALASAAGQGSFGNASQFLGLASGQGSQGTDVLNAVGNLKNNSSAFVQKSGKGF